MKEKPVDPEFIVDDESMTPATPEKPSTGSKLKKRITLALFILLNVGILVYTAFIDFGTERPKYTGEPLGWKNLLFLLGGIGCLLVFYAAETIKYLLMMRHLGEKVSVRRAFETAALGKYYDSITPSGAGGQPFQIWHLYSHGYSTGAAAAMPLTGFFTMQFGFVILALAVFLFNNNAIDAVGIKITAYIGAVVYMVVPVMIILTAVAPKVMMRIVAFFVNLGGKMRIVKNPQATIRKSVRGLMNYSKSLKSIANNPPLLIGMLALSVLLQVAICSLPYFVIHAFGGEIGYIQAVSMCVFIYAAITIVPTPGNAGAAEGSFYLLFSSLSTAGLFWAMLVWRFLSYYSFIIIGLLIYGVNALKKLLHQKE